MFKKYLSSLILNSSAGNLTNIVALVEKNPDAVLLDLGCDEGYFTDRLAKAIGCDTKYGVEIVAERAAVARKKGIKVSTADLNEKLPLPDNFFDVVLSNQVIEHLHDTDNFISELHRVLKSGGYAIVSTENLSSWHNIFALALGFQPFSIANFISKGTVGNPFSLWNNKMTENSPFKSWQHMRLFSYFGLVDLVQKFGFAVEKIKTSGYYPLPFDLSNIDKIHGHWITLKLRKP